MTAKSNSYKAKALYVSDNRSHTKTKMTAWLKLRQALKNHSTQHEYNNKSNKKQTAHDNIMKLPVGASVCRITENWCVPKEKENTYLSSLSSGKTGREEDRE